MLVSGQSLAAYTAWCSLRLQPDTPLNTVSYLYVDTISTCNNERFSFSCLIYSDHNLIFRCTDRIYWLCVTFIQSILFRGWCPLENITTSIEKSNLTINCFVKRQLNNIPQSSLGVSYGISGRFLSTRKWNHLTTACRQDCMGVDNELNLVTVSTLEEMVLIYLLWLHRLIVERFCISL